MQSCWKEANKYLQYLECDQDRSPQQHANVFCPALLPKDKIESLLVLGGRVRGRGEPPEPRDVLANNSAGS